MYITADLFDEPVSPIRSEQPTTTSWPGLPTAHAFSHPSNGLGKRKRQHLETSPCSHENLSTSGCPFSHHILTYSRPRTFDTPIYTPAAPPSSTYTTSPKYTASERRPIKQIKRQCSRTAVAKSNSHLMDIQPDFEPKPTTSSDLRPCHACRSAPKRRKDLENFLDCKRCDGRTCFICARQCCGQCEKAVCKKCVVEVGEEGDPWCLDCYSRNINA